MPFLSEEIWQSIKERKQKDALIVAKWPKAAPFESTSNQ